MAAATPKIVLSRSQDIPFNKLVLSQANVRRVKARNSPRTSRIAACCTA